MNNYKYKIAYLLSFFIIGMALTSSTLISGAPVLSEEIGCRSGIKWQHTLSKDPTSKLTEAILKNGLHVIVDERPQSATVHCSIVIGVGSRYESKELNGISHLIEHLLLCEPYDDGCNERGKIFNKISSAGGILNGSTTFEYTRYYLTAPASGSKIERSETFETVFQGLSRLILEPCFNKSGINREKKVILNEIAFTKNNPLAIAYYSFIDRIIPNDPLGRPIAGTTASLKTISFNSIKEFYQTYYVPNNMTVVIVGGVNTEIALREVNRNFSRIEEKSLPQKPFSTPPFTKRNFFGLKTLTKQGFFGLIVRTDGEKDKGKYAMRLLYSILGPGKNSRLYNKLKEEGLSDFFISAEDFGLQELASLSDIGIWGFVVGTRPDNLKRVEEIVLSEIETMKNTPVSEEELTIAKNETIGRLKIDFESNEYRASLYSHWSVSGSSGRTDRNVCPTIDAFLQEIEKISTEQITHAVQEHFKDDRLLAFTIEPAKGLGVIWAAIKFLLFKRI